jgi:glycosyltransferase involved in cell wall biosynthesis
MVFESQRSAGVAPATQQPDSGRVKVLHFVTGGFSGGATQVALALVQAARAGQSMAPLLVLRHKRHGDPARIEELRREGVPLAVVPGWSHVATILALVRLCRSFRPQVLVAHGFSEHLWGRYAGLLAGVPALVHVEHNTRERYTSWRRAQARWLGARTQRMVGCSPDVRQRLIALGMPPQRTVTIPNGVHLGPFLPARTLPWHQREAAIIMVARFAKQKDPQTLVRAVALLRAQGLRPPLRLVGDGKTRAEVERLCKSLGLDDGQVEFLGLRRDVPALLMRHQVFVLSTHYEGMPLVMLEAMAAGCAVIGSAVPGVQGMLRADEDGLLVPPSDPAALAAALASLLRDPVRAERLGARACERAHREFSRELMHQRYETLCLELAAPASGRAPHPNPDPDVAGSTDPVVRRRG